MTRREFVKATAVLTLMKVYAQARPSVRQSAEAAVNSTAAADAAPPLACGSGEFRYQYVPEKLALPAGVQMRNGHGLSLDVEGNIYFTFEPEKVEADTRCLLRFAPDGTRPVLLGSDNALAQGVPHGLNIHVEKSGRPVLYHANNDATIHKTTLDGEVLWTRRWPAEMGKYKPTETVVSPDGTHLFVADGYGSSMVHVLNTADGVYAGKSWGGLGVEHGELSCPHAISYDPRRKLLLICDRSNKRLEYYSVSGRYQGTFQHKELAAPCNTDFQGDYVLVPDLNGSMAILDKDNQVVSIIEVAKFLGDRGFKHPHDAIWLSNGDIAVCTWNPGRLAYWRKMA